MDSSVPLATIQRWLGHANISQTSKYLAATLGGDVDEMRRYEERIGRLPPNDAAQPSPSPHSQEPSAPVAVEEVGSSPTVH